MNIEEIKSQVSKVINDLLNDHPQKKGSVFVIGCSSSEVAGGKMGKNSSEVIGKAVFETANSILSEKGIFLACQCCEHLNRALVIEREAAEKYMLDEVCVRPMPKAGGSFATAVYDNMKDPVVVEHVKANAGLDIGCTLIGMHLKDVAVPIRLSVKNIGSASVNAAYTRPKLIGGVRAHYPE